MIKITVIIILTFLFTPPFQFIAKRLPAKKMTPPVYINEGSANSAPAALTVDITTNTHISNDQFLID
jgi:hypothetical protein